MNLPQWTRHALNQKLEGVSRKELAVRAEALSVNYRAQGGSMQIRAELDALAYAMVRMPATWAAARHALNQVEALLPDWKPTSLFDAGAGPGTAAWAAIDLWSSLEEATLVDQNSALLSLARTIATACGDVRVKAVEGTIPAALASAPKADLVLASYALTELPAAKLSEALAGLWKLVGEVLVVVEPGTTEGFRRVLAVRDQLIAAGANIVAPCTHHEACPIRSTERWCHFSQRLSRTRDHLQVKLASVNYEDEKLCYLVATRTLKPAQSVRRLLATPYVNKGAARLELCAPQTMEKYVIPRADKEGYKRARHYDWGDAVVLD